MNKLITWLNAKRGRRRELAAALNIFPSALSQWTQVPATQAEKVAEITGIPPHELRPDVFRAPSKEQVGAV